MGHDGGINRAFLDPYSLVHALVGVVMASFGFGLLPTLLLAVGWEVAEHLLKNVAPALFPHPSQDTLANSAGDVLASVLGWVLIVAIERRRRWRQAPPARPAARTRPPRELRAPGR